MKEIPQNVSAAVKARNPHLYPPVGGSQACLNPESPRALGRAPSSQQSRQGSLAYRITLISCRRRMLDPDNLAASTKAICDAIAETLGIDDGSERLEWQYRQIKTSGREGVVVMIEILSDKKG